MTNDRVQPMGHLTAHLLPYSPFTGYPSAFQLRRQVEGGEHECRWMKIKYMGYVFFWFFFEVSQKKE